MPMFPQPIVSLVAKSANYTAVPGDVVLGTSGSGGITVTLPAAGSVDGPVTVRKVDSGTGALTVKTADGSTIDGVAGTTGVNSTTQHAGWTFASDGANWFIIG